MENFINFLAQFGTDLLFNITYGTMGIIGNITGLVDIDILAIDINLVLFSEIPIYTGKLGELMYLFFSTFYTVIYVLIMYNIVKKVFVKITGWNKW